MNEVDLDNFEPVAKIVVIGVGGGGNNAVNRMIDEDIRNVEFWVANTDKQVLATSKAPNRLVLGESITHGLGAGGDPAVGREAAEASKEDIREIVGDANMVFIAAGMGGGTGTGAAPVIASIARECGALTVAIVTRPFGFEGTRRIANSVDGLNNLKDAADSIIVVSNDNLLISSGNRPMVSAFSESDAVLAQSVKTVTDLILVPALINLDFADVRNTLKGSGISLIGFGQGSGEKKAEKAAKAAISNPLLEASIAGARKAICSVTCGSEVTMYEARDCVNRIKVESGGELDMIFGVAIIPQLGDTIMVSVIASDFVNGGVDFIRDIDPNPSHDFGVMEVPVAKENTEEENPLDSASDNEDLIDSILPDFLRK